MVEEERTKLYFGDCLDIMPTIPENSVDMILCDLPYGTTSRNKWDVVIPFEPLWLQYKRIIKSGGAIVLFAQLPFACDIINSNRKWFRYEWIFEKPNAVGFLNANRMPLRAHENILVFYDKLPTYNPQKTHGKPYTHKPVTRITLNYGHYKGTEITNTDGKRYPRDVIKLNTIERGLHPTQKPVVLLEYLIKTYTNAGQTVLDNCMGSGSTGVACINTNRKFIGIEKDEGYFEVARNRLEEMIHGK